MSKASLMKCEWQKCNYTSHDWAFPIRYYRTWQVVCNHLHELLKVRPNCLIGFWPMPWPIQICSVYHISIDHHDSLTVQPFTVKPEYPWGRAISCPISILQEKQGIARARWVREEWLESSPEWCTRGACVFSKSYFVPPAFDKRMKGNKVRECDRCSFRLTKCMMTGEANKSSFTQLIKAFSFWPSVTNRTS